MIQKSLKIKHQIWVYGDSYQSKLIAVVHPKPHALKQWAKDSGVEGASSMTYEQLCALPAAGKWVAGELAAAGKGDRLKGFEMIAAVRAFLARVSCA